MNCKFCNQLCQKHASGPYHLCSPCKVFFNESKREIVYRPNTPPYWYWLTINLDEDTTIVEYERDPNYMTEEERRDIDPALFSPQRIIAIKSALQNVTPQNMHEKLKTLLIFS